MAVSSSADVRAGLVVHFDQTLIDELIAAYDEAKRNYYLGGHRLSAVEGGRFCEAAFRMLQHVTTHTFTPLGTQLDTDKLIRELALLPTGSFSDSIRLHIPRALRVVYDIRNKRDVAHLSDGIDPNVQDSTLVVSVLDWTLAEFLRLYHNVPANEAQSAIEGIVTRIAPSVQDFDGFLKVLKPGLRTGDFMLLLLYQRGSDGATFDNLRQWARPHMRANLKATLDRLVDQKAYAHLDNGLYRITLLGERYVEEQRLME